FLHGTDVRFRSKAEMPRGLHAPNNVRFKRCVRCDAPDDATDAKFEKASPFRPRIAPTRPLLGQCDAIATGRYISPGRSIGDGGLYAAYFRDRDSWSRDIRECAINQHVGLR